MPEVITSKVLIRRGNLGTMPVLSPGEFGLAEDEQRLFLGQQPIIGSVSLSESTDTVAVVTFSTKYKGAIKKLDLDQVRTYYVKVNNTTDVGPLSIEAHNEKMYIPHGLGRVPTLNDEFVLYYNKEIVSYNANLGANEVNATRFTKELPYGTAETTGIQFITEAQNFITFEYLLFGVGGVRKGRLDMYVEEGVAPKITDTYTADSALDDIEFSLTENGGMFELMFDTSVTDQLQFNYIPTSFRRMITINVTVSGY
jgi:hypothetical protein